MLAYLAWAIVVLTHNNDNYLIIIIELLYNKSNYVYLWGLEVQNYHLCLFQYDLK